MTKRKPNKRTNGKAKSRKRKSLKQLSPTYRRRIKRGLAKGLTRSQSRGHPTIKEKHIAEHRIKKLTKKEMQDILTALTEKKTVKEAAAYAGVSPERFRHFAATSPYINKRGRRYLISDDTPTRVQLFSRGREVVIYVPYKASHEVGAYRNAVGRYFETEEISYLDPFRGKSVTDIKGDVYPYETNHNRLFRLDEASTEPFHEVYKLVA